MFKYNKKWYSKNISFAELSKLIAGLTDEKYFALTGNKPQKKQVEPIITEKDEKKGKSKT